jgi:hypothetical protein
LSTERDRTAITAPEDTRRQIEGLVQRFARNLDVYTRPDYKQTQVRVERMLDLHKRLAAATIPGDKKLYQRQIEATDGEIDALVYGLYGLTEEETAIVEGWGNERDRS